MRPTKQKNKGLPGVGDSRHCRDGASGRYFPVTPHAHEPAATRMVRFRLIRLIRLTAVLPDFSMRPICFDCLISGNAAKGIFPCSGQSPAIAQGAVAMIRPSLHGAGRDSLPRTRYRQLSAACLQPTNNMMRSSYCSVGTA
jgi:hypothetical protein